MKMESTNEDFFTVKIILTEKFLILKVETAELVADLPNDSTQTLKTHRSGSRGISVELSPKNEYSRQ